MRNKINLKELKYFQEINEYFYLTRYPRDEFIKLFNDCLETVEFGADISKKEFMDSVFETSFNHINFGGVGSDNKWEVLRQYGDPEDINLKDATQYFEDDLYNVALKIREKNIALEKEEMEE